MSSRRPTLAVVGRPNVGKSTLVNRIIGRREAVVQDIPGVTRDRVSYDALWRGRKFTVVDTGGWEPDADGLQGAVAAQAERAMLTTDAVLVVVDAIGRRDRHRRGDGQGAAPVPAPGDPGRQQGRRRTRARPTPRRCGRWDSASRTRCRRCTAAVPVTCWTRCWTRCRRRRRSSPAPATGPRRVALLGKPNVGKSSLLNKLSGESRSVVDAVAGTTIDPVDSLVELDGQVWRFVDTAGLRRRVNQAKGMEFYASLRTQTALEAAEVAIVLIDSSVPLTEQDQRVITMVIESGRALVIAMNKADLVDADRREEIERELSRDLDRVTWAERINISAQTGRGVHRLAPAMQTALNSWDRRIPTGRLNSWLGELIAATPPPVRSGKQPQVLFATQAANRPPTFVLFTSGFLEAGYRRFIERRLREDFDFTGSPVRVNVRVREKRGGRKG